MSPCATCAAAFAVPIMSAASFPVDGGAQPASLPRLDRVLTAAARAALATRRRGAVMAPETREKIAETARRNRATRAVMVQQSLSAAKRGRKTADVGPGEPAPEEGKTNVDGRAKRKGAKMSDERKRKISEAMKGRAKSAEHKQKLSERLSGTNNPMYGRKVSDETRAKISLAVAASRAAKKAARDGVAADSIDVDGADADESDVEVLPISPELHDKVMRSRLIASLSKPKRTVEEIGEEAALDDLLARVAAGKLPPEAVKRMRNGVQDKAAKAEVDEVEANVFVSAADASSDGKSGNDVSLKAGQSKSGRKRDSTTTGAAIAAPRPSHGKLVRKVPKSKKNSVRRNVQGEVVEKMPKCGTCLGSGNVVCVHCVGRVGLASKHCSVCAGAAVTFCPQCLGTGEEEATGMC